MASPRSGASPAPACGSPEQAGTGPSCSAADVCPDHAGTLLPDRRAGHRRAGQVGGSHASDRIRGPVSPMGVGGFPQPTRCRHGTRPGAAGTAPLPPAQARRYADRPLTGSGAPCTLRACTALQESPPWNRPYTTFPICSPSWALPKTRRASAASLPPTHRCPTMSASRKRRSGRRRRQLLLRAERIDDADWANVVDRLNLALRARA